MSDELNRRDLGLPPKTADDKATMTLNLTAREMAVVEALAASHELSKTALIRQALRLYQLVHHRISQGETMTFSGDKERVALFVGPGFDMVQAEQILQQHGLQKASDKEG